MKVFDGPRAIHLGSKLGTGADGAVYAVQGSETSCIKIFDPGTRRRLAQNLPRIGNLIKLAPSLGSNAAVPTHLVAETPNGPAIGFGMKRIDGKEVHNLYGVSSRQIHFPGVDFRFLVQVAKNAAIATERLHHHNVVIGDISGRNMMVRKDATVCWIDSDSFLIGNPGFRDICTLVTPEWTPPELQNDRHLQAPRLPGHDAFGLAVMIFHILMLGRHPFQGRFTGQGEAPDIPRNIGNRWYPHAGYPAIPLKSPIGTPPVSHLGPVIEQLFVRAFFEVAAERRPSSAEWVAAMTKLEGSLRKCPNSSAHYHSSAATRCPWCQVLPEYGNMDPFQGVVTVAGNGAGTGAATGGLGGEIAGFIASLGAPGSTPNALYRPTAGTRTATWSYAKPGWFASLFSSMTAEIRRVQAIKTRFGSQVSNLESKMMENLRLQQVWLIRIGVCSRKFGELQVEAGGKITVSSLRVEAGRLLEAPHIERERVIHLAKFRIEVGLIPGIGQKRVSELSGHGITTAADIVENRIWGIPGFGESLTNSLMEWRKKMERSFRRTPANIPVAQIEQRARELFSTKKVEFLARRRLLVRELDQLIQDAKECAGQAVALQRQLDEARANMMAAEKALRGLV